MVKERMPHDSAYKQLFSHPEMVESLLRDFVPADFITDLNFSTLERCSGSYITDDLRERRSDVVWRIGWKNGSWCYVALLLEFQSTTDHWMALRMLSYTTLLLLDLIKTEKIDRREGLPPVLPIVIYNGSRAWKAPQQVSALFAPMVEDLKTYRPEHRYFLLDEKSVSDDDLNKSGSLFALLLKLERAFTPEAMHKTVDELRIRLNNDKYSPLIRAFSAFVYQIIIKRFETQAKTCEPQNLQEVCTMLEERVDQWKADYIHQGVLIGIKEGEARGEARGEAKGTSIGMRKLLKNFIELRFGTIPQDVITYISDISDENVINNIMMSAYYAKSMQDFIDHLDQYGRN